MFHFYSQSPEIVVVRMSDCQIVRLLAMCAKEAEQSNQLAVHMPILSVVHHSILFKVKVDLSDFFLFISSMFISKPYILLKNCVV